MTTVPAPLDHVWWIASRAAGIVALAALTASVVLGLLMANGLPRRRGIGRTLLSLHESTALTGLIAVAVHGVTLLGDPWLEATLWRIAVPGTIEYRPLWTGAGIVAGWTAAALGLSFYVRARIGPKLWRRLHRATIGAWALAVGHTLGAGTDAAQPWLRIPLAGAGVAVLFLLLRRMVPGDPKREARRAPVQLAPDSTPIQETA